MSMRKIGFPFETASNGFEAVKAFEKNSKDIGIILMGKSTYSFQMPHL